MGVVRRKKHVKVGVVGIGQRQLHGQQRPVDRQRHQQDHRKGIGREK